MSAHSQPEHVTATATFLGLVYPGRGLERTVRKEHIDNMTAGDYVKVWKVQAFLKQSQPFTLHILEANSRNLERLICRTMSAS